MILVSISHVHTLRKELLGQSMLDIACIARQDTL
ncbi:hypothetical protein A2U01_0053932, partial [Trifolium medium]|nr:hypothetical protein [Trifolium medium]